MQNVETRNTRNFALIGHTGDGKTSLAEALLHAAGATAALGKVDDGSSVLDHTPEERERHHTLTSALYGFAWNDFHITLVDTPGDPNFQGDGQVALHALDGAILLVSAVDGTQVGTESMWRASERSGTPLLAFVNGLDRDRADLRDALESLRRMGANPVEVLLPIGSAAALKGVVDLLQMKATVEGRQVEIPEELAEEAASARQRLVESVAESDDELLERYLEEGELDGALLARGLVAAASARSLLPVLCGSATRQIGTREALRLATQLLPSPLEGPARKGLSLDSELEVEVSPDPAGPFAALVLKTVVDRYTGTLSIFRVVSGTIKADTPVLNATRDRKERLGKLLLPRGAEYVDVPEAGPGDIVAVAKLKDVHTGDALTLEKGGIRLPRSRFPRACSPTRSGRRPRATRTRSSPRSAGSPRKTRSCGWEGTLRPVNSCSPGWASFTSA
jgi:elongation factor G